MIPKDTSKLSGQPRLIYDRSNAGYFGHLPLVEVIADCEALLCRGMGSGAYESIKATGIRPVVTELVNIEEVVQAYKNGQIVDHVERLH